MSRVDEDAELSRLGQDNALEPAGPQLEAGQLSPPTDCVFARSGQTPGLKMAPVNPIACAV